MIFKIKQSVPLLFHNAWPSRAVMAAKYNLLFEDTKYRGVELLVPALIPFTNTVPVCVPSLRHILFFDELDNDNDPVFKIVGSPCYIQRKLISYLQMRDGIAPFLIDLIKSGTTISFLLTNAATFRLFLFLIATNVHTTCYHFIDRHKKHFASFIFNFYNCLRLPQHIVPKNCLTFSNYIILVLLTINL